MTRIFIRTQKEGIHFYKDAPEEVAYLRNPHRHIFHIKVTIEVFHDDRDIEFILFKQYVDSLLKDNHSFKSCEMIAKDLYAEINKKYPGRSVEIEVSEDNENGAILSWDK